MHRLIADIGKSHNLSAEDAAALVEIAAGRALSDVMGIDAYARFSDGGIQFCRFCPDRGEVEIDARSLSRKVERRLAHEIRKMLAAEDIVQDFRRASRLLHKVVVGKIRSFNAQNVFVELGIDSKKVVAVCPARGLMSGDVPQYGKRLKWYVSAVAVQPGMPPRLSIRLSRTSKEFVVALLREKAGLVSDQCLDFAATRRIPGQFTELAASCFVPHFALQSVARELGERIIFKRGMPRKGECA